MPTIALVNPNTNQHTTARMLAIARAALPAEYGLVGFTAAAGSPFIKTQAQLADAEAAVQDMVVSLRAGFDGVVVAAFGDPGLAWLRAILNVPVVGIREAGLLAAGRTGRRFCVVTTTPGLVAAIDHTAHALGLGELYAGVMLTEGDVDAVMRDPERLESEMTLALDRAGRVLNVDVAVIGGGPLAEVARSLAKRDRFTVIEPLPEAISDILGRIAAAPIAPR